MPLGLSNDDADILMHLGHCTLYYNTIAGATMQTIVEKKFWEPEGKVERPWNREACMDHDLTLQYI
jgi:hypothetical protein